MRELSVSEIYAAEWDLTVPQPLGVAMHVWYTRSIVIYLFIYFADLTLEAAAALYTYVVKQLHFVHDLGYTAKLTTTEKVNIENKLFQLMS